jgi:hypothetical protein
MEIDNLLDYAGCKSWVPLKSAIDTRAAVPVLDDQTFERRRRQIIEAVRTHS